MSETAVGSEADATPAQEETKEALHGAGSRRLRLQELEAFFKPQAVPPGTQQHTAMASIRDRARVLALTIEERCPQGPEKVLAIRKAQEAMFWANQAISHR